MTWKDIYEFPLEIKHTETRVYDNKNNFVFQFVQYDKICNQELLGIINSEFTMEPAIKFKHEDGYIFAGDTKIILIRGWGNLTGSGAHNLSDEDAANIQDTFAEHIVNKLNGI